MIEMLSVIVEIIASFVEIYVLYDIFQLLLSNNKSLRKNKANWIVMLVALLLMQGLNAVSLFSSATIIIMILFWSISGKMLHLVDYITVLSIAGVYALATVAYDFFFFSTVGALGGGYDTFMALIASTNQSRMIVVLINKALWILCYFIGRRYLTKVQFNRDNRDFFFKITVAGFIACLILAKITFDGFPDTINQMWFILVCVLVFLVFYHAVTMNMKMHKAQLEMVALRNQLLEENFEALNDVYTRNAELYHDLNNHLDTLYQLLDANKVSDAKEYIERIGEPIKDLNKVIWTGVDVVDVILNSKIKKGERLGINLSYNVEYPSNSSIRSNDICTILSNLIDNAIEATAKGDTEKDIKVTIRKINNFVTIRVVNSIFEPVITKAGKIITTKRDTLLHGWGMQSVNAAVEKYEGSVKSTYDNQQFTVTVILFF